MQPLKSWLLRYKEPTGYCSSAFLSSSAVESLGSPEPPPEKGLLRKAGFRCRQLWRRFAAEFVAEWPLLKPRLWVIIPLLIFQYMHAIFTGMAYYMHTPLPEEGATLGDLGFDVLPYLDVDAVSEILVYGAFAGFFIWLLSPFFTRRKSFHAAVVLKRVLVILVSCQVLRILTFLSTQLPAPAPHCRAPEPTSNVPWPVWWKVIIVDVARQASKGCGDLIFSSHLTFLLTFSWTYACLGHSLLLKAAAFLYTAGTALCIIASRKHYTVDVTVAFYVIPLVFFHYRRHWTTLRDDICTADNRSIVSLAQVLPLASNPRRSSGSIHNGKLGLAQGSGRQLAGRESAADAAGLPAGGSGDLVLEMELTAGTAGAAHSSSSAPVLDAAASGSSQRGSRVDQAWSALSDMPRRLGSRPSSGAPGHRRTDSREPVLFEEDPSASTSH